MCRLPHLLSTRLLLALYFLNNKASAIVCQQSGIEIDDLPTTKAYSFDCFGEPFGPVQMYWEVTQTFAPDLVPEDYVIRFSDNPKDPNDFDYQGREDGTASGSSPLISINPDLGKWFIRFGCINFRQDCDDLVFKYVVVDCGCPPGQAPTQFCDARQARDAFCAPTQAPTVSPTRFPTAPPTRFPTARPSPAPPTRIPTARPSPTPPNPNAFCEGREIINDIEDNGVRNFNCPGTTLGQARLFWEVSSNPSSETFIINVFEDSNKVYEDGSHSNTLFSSSGPIGPTGGDSWYVQFECDNFVLDCDRVDFKFVLVDCGCPPGQSPSIPCRVNSLETASNAVCAPAPPTQSPPTGPTGKPDGCFSEKTTVEVKTEKGSITLPMNELQIGDHVRSIAGWEKVYAFAHFAPDQQKDYLRIKTQWNFIEITAEHMMFLHDEKVPVRADAVKLGDKLRTITNTTEIVVAIDHVKRQGLYAPLTPSGLISVADGIVASNYIALQPQSNADTHLDVIGKIPISQHDLSHYWLAPLRLICTKFSWDNCYAYNNDGYNHFAKFGLDFATYMDKQSLPFQLGAFFLSVLIFCPILALETVVESDYKIGHLVAFVAFLSSWWWIAWTYWHSTGK